MGKLIDNQEPRLKNEGDLDDEDQNDDLENPNEDEDDEDQNDDGDGDSGDDPEGADQLRDEGKKALDRMKAERNEAKRSSRAKDAKIAELERQLASKDKSPEEKQREEERQKHEAEVIAKANARVVRSEIRAAAAGKLKNPALALKLLDPSDFDVDDNGDVDTDQIQEAISELLDDNPYLAAQGGTGSFDSGRGKQPAKKKLSKDDLSSMTPEQIAKAYNEGRIKF